MHVLASDRRRPKSLAIGGALVLVLTSACSSSDGNAAEEQRLATELVAATQQAGVAPDLTVETAEALYGSEAPTACRAFEGGTSTAADLVLRTNLAMGHRKTITTDAVTYARLVVQTYCPEVLPAFLEDVDNLDPIRTTR